MKTTICSFAALMVASTQVAALEVQAGQYYGSSSPQGYYGQGGSPQHYGRVQNQYQNNLAAQKSLDSARYGQNQYGAQQAKNVSSYNNAYAPYRQQQAKQVVQNRLTGNYGSKPSYNNFGAYSAPTSTYNKPAPAYNKPVTTYNKPAATYNVSPTYNKPANTYNSQSYPYGTKVQAQATPFSVGGPGSYGPSSYPGSNVYGNNAYKPQVQAAQQPRQYGAPTQAFGQQSYPNQYSSTTPYGAAGAFNKPQTNQGLYGANSFSQPQQQVSDPPRTYRGTRESRPTGPPKNPFGSSVPFGGPGGLTQDSGFGKDSNDFKQGFQNQNGYQFEQPEFMRPDYIDPDTTKAQQERWAISSAGAGADTIVVDGIVEVVPVVEEEPAFELEFDELGYAWTEDGYLVDKRGVIQTRDPITRQYLGRVTRDGRGEREDYQRKNAYEAREVREARERREARDARAMRDAYIPDRPEYQNGGYQATNTDQQQTNQYDNFLNSGNDGMIMANQGQNVMDDPWAKIDFDQYTASPNYTQNQWEEPEINYEPGFGNKFSVEPEPITKGFEEDEPEVVVVDGIVEVEDGAEGAEGEEGEKGDDVEIKEELEKEAYMTKAYYMPGYVDTTPEKEYPPHIRQFKNYIGSIGDFQKHGYEKEDFGPDTAGFAPDTAGFGPDSSGFAPDTQGFGQGGAIARPNVQGFGYGEQSFRPEEQSYRPQTQNFQSSPRQPQRNFAATAPSRGQPSFGGSASYGGQQASFGASAPYGGQQALYGGSAPYGGQQALYGGSAPYGGQASYRAPTAAYGSQAQYGNSAPYGGQVSYPGPTSYPSSQPAYSGSYGGGW